MFLWKRLEGVSVGWLNYSLHPTSIYHFMSRTNKRFAHSPNFSAEQHGLRRKAHGKPTDTPRQKRLRANMAEKRKRSMGKGAMMDGCGVIWCLDVCHKFSQALFVFHLQWWNEAGSLGDRALWNTFARHSPTHVHHDTCIFFGIKISKTGRQKDNESMNSEAHRSNFRPVNDQARNLQKENHLSDPSLSDHDHLDSTLGKDSSKSQGFSFLFLPT